MSASAAMILVTRLSPSGKGAVRGTRLRGAARQMAAPAPRAWAEVPVLNVGLAEIQRQVEAS